MQAPETKIRNWIQKELSTPRQIFGNLPACPYAAEALIKNKVTIEFLAPENLFDQIERQVSTFHQNKYEVCILGVENFSSYSVRSVEEFAGEMRKKYYIDDVWLLFDHPDDPEVVQEFSLKQGEYLLFFIQSLSSVCKKSLELQKTDYYKMWGSDYFSEVVLKRQDFYENMIQDFERELS